LVDSDWWSMVILIGTPFFRKRNVKKSNSRFFIWFQSVSGAGARVLRKYGGQFVMLPKHVAIAPILTITVLSVSLSRACVEMWVYSKSVYAKTSEVIEDETLEPAFRLLVILSYLLVGQTVRTDTNQYSYM